MEKEKGMDFVVRNCLNIEKRDLNVFHQATRSAYMISYGNTVTVSLSPLEEGDYLYLSLVSGPGEMERNCCISVPPWCRFTISGFRNGEIEYLGDKMAILIPPGLPTWHLKISRPPGPVTGNRSTAAIIVGDSENICIESRVNRS